MATHAVIGLGQLGSAVATYLAEQGEEVIAVDTNEARVEALKDRVARALCMDATDAKALRAAGFADCATVMVALGEDQLGQMVLTIMELRDLGVGRIICRAAGDVQARVLERLGVSRVVFPERQMGIQIARQILAPSVHDLVPISGQACMAEVEVPPAMANKTLGDLALRRAHGLNVVALRRRKQTIRDDGTTSVNELVESVIGPETKVNAGDVLVVVGSDESVRSFSERR